MSTNGEAARAGNSAASRDSNVLQFEVYPQTSTDRKGRQRYVRLFPERIYFLLAHLTAGETVAYLRVLVAFAVADGALRADDKALAATAQVSRKTWATLRDRLIELGVWRVAEGLLTDDDQFRNLEIQRAVSARQAARARRRWGQRDA